MSRKCARPPSRAAATCWSSSSRRQPLRPRSKMCAAKVPDAKRDLPQAAEEPTINEVNLSEFPVLVVTLAGDVPEREPDCGRTRIARPHRGSAGRARGRPARRARGSRRGHHRSGQAFLLRPAARPARCRASPPRTAWLPPATSKAPQGTLRGEGAGADRKRRRMSPTFRSLPAPTRSCGPRDLATIRSTFKDAETITRLDGKPAIAIEVKKRTGANLVETVDQVKAVADAFAKRLPEGSVVSYSQDKSTSIRQLLGDLQNHVMIAVILVFIVILYALSGRASMLIGLAIPYLVPDRHPDAFDDRADGQYRRAVQPDPGGRHAGRRCHHRHRIRRAAHGRGHERRRTPTRLRPSAWPARSSQRR